MHKLNKTGKTIEPSGTPNAMTAANEVKLSIVTVNTLFDM